MWIVPLGHSAGMSPEGGRTALARRLGSSYPAVVNLPLGILAFLGAVLFTFGGLTAFIAWRRGHNPVAWYLVGFVLGPMGLLLALTSRPLERTQHESNGRV